MTTDIDVSNHNHGEVRESEEVEVVVVANNGGEQRSGFDVVGPTQDLLPKSNGNKDDVDGSYVFVTGHDDGDDLVESDLANDNNKPVEEFQVEEKNNVGRDTKVSGSADEFNSPPSQVADDGQVQEGGEDIQESDIAVKNSDEQGLAEDVEKDQESDIGVEKDTNYNDDDDDDDNVVNDNTDQEVEMPEESLNQIPLEVSRDDPNQEDPSTVSSCLESEIKPDTVIEEMTISGDNGDGFPDVHEKDDEASQCLDVHENQNGSSENVESVPSSGEIGDSLPDGHGQDDATRSVEEDVHEHQVAQNTEIGQQSSPTALDCEKPSSFSEEVPAEGSKEHNLETTSTAEGDKTLETGVANGPLFEQIGESSPAGFAHESLLETAVGTEQDGPPTALDNEKLSSFSEGVPVEEFKGDDGESLGEHSLKTPSSTGVDKTLETAVFKGPLLEQNGEDLPPGLAQESLSETAVVTEQIGPSENSESLTSSSICSYVALESGQSLPTKDVTSEIDTGESNQESIENPDDSCPVETQNCPVMNDAESKCAANGVIFNPESCGASNGGEEKASADAIDVESAISNTSLECGDNQHMSNTSIELESEVDNALNDKDSGIAADGDLDFEHVGKELKSTCQEAECFEGKQTDETPKSVQENLGGQNVDIDGNQKDEEASTTLPDNTLEGQNAAVEGGKRLLYLIKIPRFDDGNLREQIEHTKVQVEERTKSREAIYAEVQKQRVIHKECSDKVQACLTEEKAARDSFKSTRQRLDSVQSVIDKVKNAQSVGDIQEKIRSMKNRIEHETLPLKEEKHLIREIEQLQQQCKHISSNVGKQGEVLQALDQKDQIEEHSKVLRKELDSQREKLTKAEEVTQTAKKKSKVENEKLNELVYQFRDANDVRQEAYAHLQSLKKQQYERNKHFWRYKDALSAAQKLALSGDKEQLQHLCNDQLETVMELWNRNDDFRREYMIYNTRSTLRRLRTLDGRSLGPDEAPPVIPDAIVINNRATKDNSVSLTKIPEQEKQYVPAKDEKLDDAKSGAKVVERENQTAKTKKPAKLASLSGTRPVTISGEDERKEEAREEEKEEEEEEEEQPRRSKEEEELARKAEELRKEEEAAKLKEQRKLEERAKAKEAMERKKRIAEKAQTRAAIKAQKEAEEKEKEREKRARKKEKKKANGIETRNEDGIECAPTPSSEIPSNGAQPESEKPATVMKRPQKAQQFTKQSRTRSVAMPPPLRNRGKTRMQPWMWVTLAVAIVLALFFCWPSFMQWFGF